MQKIKLPTGYLIVDDYSKGKLETLSIGDYGKSHNIKADFLGYSKEINGVPDGFCKPLSDKWVITLSTQYGCIQKCKFCACPNVKFNGNATFDDLLGQFNNAIDCFPIVRNTDRLNLHFARMGEPVVNNDVFKFSRFLYKEKGGEIFSRNKLRIETIHPVLTTSLPKKFKKLEEKLFEWCDIKNNVYNGQAGLQISINSTNKEQRDDMFNNCSLSIENFSKIADKLPNPIGRKYCLNFAYSSNFEINAEKLSSLFSPEKWMVKITPIHNNQECRKNGYETKGGYTSFKPYQEVEQSLKSHGFDVLIFVPSMDEEKGLVTCGNAILGGSKMDTKNVRMKIEGQSE